MSEPAFTIDEAVEVFTETRKRFYAGPLSTVKPQHAEQLVEAEADQFRLDLFMEFSKKAQNPAESEMEPQPLGAAVLSEIFDGIETPQGKVVSAPAGPQAPEGYVLVPRDVLQPFLDACAGLYNSHDDDAVLARPGWAGKDYSPPNLRMRHLRALKRASPASGWRDPGSRE